MAAKKSVSRSVSSLLGNVTAVVGDVALIAKQKGFVSSQVVIECVIAIHEARILCPRSSIKDDLYSHVLITSRTLRN